MEQDTFLIPTIHSHIFETRNGVCVLYDTFQDENGNPNPSGELVVVGKFIIFDETGSYLNKASTLEDAKDKMDKYCQSLNPNFD